MAKKHPFLVQVSLATGVTENLLTLLQAVESGIPERCSGISIQFDLTGGADHLFLGNITGDITAARGRELVAGQEFSMSFESNIIMLGDITIRTPGVGKIAMCAIMVR